MSYEQNQGQEKNINWVDNEEIFDSLRNKSNTLFNKLEDQVCVSENFEYCLLIRTHEAWHVENQGWRDSNNKPDNKDNGRLILNFFKVDKNDGIESWFKIFLPLKYNDYKLLAIEKNNYKIITGNNEIVGKFDSFDSLMWNFITGNAEQETEIEYKFIKIGNQ